MKKIILTFFAFMLVPFIAGATTDCSVLNEQNLNECRFLAYNFNDNQGLIGTVLQQTPEGLAIPTVKEPGQLGGGETGYKLLALIPIEEMSSGSKEIYAYVADLWYANRDTQTATRYLFKYNAKKQLIKELTIIEAQAFCDYPYFKGVPAPCRVKSRIDLQSDFYRYCGKYRQVDGPKNFSEGADLLVKQLMVGRNAPETLLLTVYPGSQFSEVNVAINYDSKKKEFVFDSGDYGYCEDPDCEGIASVRGRLITMADQYQYAVITATIFKAKDAEVKTYEQTWTYRADLSNGSYCHP